jgi:hypothetical protein
MSITKKLVGSFELVWLLFLLPTGRSTPHPPHGAAHDDPQMGQITTGDADMSSPMH